MFIRRPFARVGRPGLLGTMARTAVVAGTATAVVGGVQRHQAARAQQSAELADYRAEEQAESMPPPPAAADPVAELERLAALKQQGVLSDAEFSAAKSKLLGL